MSSPHSNHFLEFLLTFKSDRSGTLQILSKIGDQFQPASKPLHNEHIWESATQVEVWKKPNELSCFSETKEIFFSQKGLFSFHLLFQFEFELPLSKTKWNVFFAVLHWSNLPVAICDGFYICRILLYIPLSLPILDVDINIGGIFFRC